MELTVRDIQKLWEHKSAALVAGTGGLDRVVEYYDMMEQPDVQPWLRENVLMITTGYAIRNNKRALLDLIRSMNEANAAALAIKTRFFEEFPREALELADSLDFPLFFLNNDAGFIEAVYPIMVAIVEAKNNVELFTRYQMGEYNQKELDSKLFTELLNGKITQEEEAEYRVNALHWPAAPMRIVVFRIIQDSQATASREENMDKIYRNVKIFLDTSHVWGTVVNRKDECICILKDLKDKDKLTEICREICRRISVRYRYEAVAGISSLFGSYLELKSAYRQAQDAVKIAKIPRIGADILWIEDELFEQVMLRISGEEYVQRYVKDTLACVEIYDRDHESNLEQTLEALLRHSGSKKLAAEELYVHRNSMAYRVKQIEKLMDCDLSSPEHLMRLGFACRVKEYMKDNKN
ncbi:MAG: PucR family transcriptional regulator ligand-binding domain-containing protein [Eubacteriales bacterium]|nr:PucR family transcriptional regulator ligand-binding domain-containing protein [Eubacteriales bacterium]